MTNLAESPVFVSGVSRSGKTLLGCLLDGHPDILVFPEEARLFIQIVPRFQSGGPEAGIDFIIGRFRSQYGIADHFQLSEPGLTQYEAKLRERFGHSDRSAKAFVQAVILAYGDITGQQDKRLWMEGTQGNAGFSALISEWFPHARMIHVVRDPRGSLPGIREVKALSAEVFAKRWKSAQRERKCASARMPLMQVSYEDLVQDHRGVLNRVCEFLDMSWDDSLLKPTKNGDLWGGSLSAGTSSDELNTWRDSLPKNDVKILEYLLSKEMTSLGYALSEPISRLTSLGMFFRLSAIRHPRTFVTRVSSGVSQALKVCVRAICKPGYGRNGRTENG